MIRISGAILAINGDLLEMILFAQKSIELSLHLCSFDELPK